MHLSEHLCILARPSKLFHCPWKRPVDSMLHVSISTTRSSVATSVNSNAYLLQSAYSHWITVSCPTDNEAGCNTCLPLKYPAHRPVLPVWMHVSKVRLFLFFLFHPIITTIIIADAFNRVLGVAKPLRRSCRVRAIYAQNHTSQTTHHQAS